MKAFSSLLLAGALVVLFIKVGSQMEVNSLKSNSAQINVESNTSE